MAIVMSNNNNSMHKLASANSHTLAASPTAVLSPSASPTQNTDGNNITLSSAAYDPIDLLRLEFTSNDYETSVHAIYKIIPTSIELGPVKSRTQLIPYLYEVCTTVENDEILTGVAASLGAVATIILNDSTQSGQLLPPGSPWLPLLERLMGEEECVVRETACEALSSVLPLLASTGHTADIIQHIVPMTKRLATGDWFTTRVSACNLIAPIYAALSPATSASASADSQHDNVRAELRSIFATLSNDDTPMVKKKAYSTLHRLAAILPRQYYKTDIYTVLKMMLTDDLDNIRMSAIENICVLIRLMPTAVAAGGSLQSVMDDFHSVVIPYIEQLTNDASWRIRMATAEKFDQLCAYTVIHPSVASTSASLQPIPKSEQSDRKLILLYMKLVKDIEPEVRNAAVKNLAVVATSLRYAGISDVITPVLDSLSNDSVQTIRISFSDIVVPLSAVYGKELTNKVIIPLVNTMSHDDCYEVRNNLLKRLDLLCEEIGSAGIVSSVLPAIIDLSKDSKWRVRESVVRNTNLLASVLGVKVFEKRLQPILQAALSDHVYAIRETACQQLGLIVGQYGDKWAAEKLFPTVFTIFDKNINYLHRMTCLMIINHCLPSVASETMERHLMPIILAAASDDVPNVRVGAAQSINHVVSKLDTKSIQTRLLPPVTRLAADADPDVQHFGSVALRSCEARIASTPTSNNTTSAPPSARSKVLDGAVTTNGVDSITASTSKMTI